MEEEMRTRRPAPWLLCLLAATLWPAAPGFARPEQEPTPTENFIIRGKWNVDYNKPDSVVWLTRDPGKAQKAQGADPTPLHSGDIGVQRPSGTEKKAVSFKIHRDAGDFEFTGEANASQAAGRFVFMGDDDFEGGPSTEQLYFMTLYDVSFEFIRNLQGFTAGQKPTFDQLVPMRMYGVDNPFLFGLKSLGYAAVPIPDAIAIRKNGLTVDDARKIKAGRPAITLRELAREKPRPKEKS